MQIPLGYIAFMSDSIGLWNPVRVLLIRTQGEPDVGTLEIYLFQCLTVHKILLHIISSDFHL